ncbi:hypothetical protein LWI28_027612 [Acer negundo]|uniref:Uncharacterized protein n=1 Tax=Acer negundo TaxID=4023 RepID=A0AAD5IW87_ACENE|nr:hypothetical protein LWI28_027612 [Acer negundo]
MPRELSHSRSRSPSYRRRHSPSPRYSRRSRRDRSRSPFSHSRRKSRSISPRRGKGHSPTPRRRKSRSPTPRRHKRQRSGSISLSPTHKLLSPSLGSVEQKNASEKLRKEEEEKKRRQLEAELKLIDEETARRVEEAIRKKVEESLNCDEIKLEIQRWLEEGRKRLQDEVAAQLEKEKEEALIEARRKEEQARREIEELEKMLEENQRRVEESQRKEAEEQQRREEERYRELECIQREKEEAMRRKKQQEEEERLNQMKLLGTLSHYLWIGLLGLLLLRWFGMSWLALVLAGLLSLALLVAWEQSGAKHVEHRDSYDGPGFVGIGSGAGNLSKGSKHVSSNSLYEGSDLELEKILQVQQQQSPLHNFVLPELKLTVSSNVNANRKHSSRNHQPPPTSRNEASFDP